MRPSGVPSRGTEPRDEVSLDRDKVANPESGAGRSGRPRRTPPRPSGPRGLPARKDPRSDLSERPVCASEGRFRGVAPVRRGVRRRCAGRPAQIHKSLPDKALARPRVFRGGRASGFSRARRVFRCDIFPETANDDPQVGRTTAPFWENGHGEGTAGLRGAGVQSRPGQRSSRRSSAQCSRVGAVPTIAA